MARCFAGPTQVTVNGETTEYPLVPYPYMGGYPQCNQHGFYYEVEAVHRCLAKGLRETPQHTRADCKGDTPPTDWLQSR